MLNFNFWVLNLWPDLSEHLKIILIWFKRVDKITMFLSVMVATFESTTNNVLSIVVSGQSWKKMRRREISLAMSLSCVFQCALLFSIKNEL